MEAKELRIGNLIYCTATNANNKITGIFFDVEYERYCVETESCNELITGISPVSLTEDWLIKFGYECSFKDIRFAAYDLTKDKFFGFNISSSELKGNSLIGFRFGKGVYLPNIKYVHQLQNLYFALTGSELTIQHHE